MAWVFSTVNLSKHTKDFYRSKSSFSYVLSIELKSQKSIASKCVKFFHRSINSQKDTFTKILRSKANKAPPNLCKSETNNKLKLRLVKNVIGCSSLLGAKVAFSTVNVLCEGNVHIDDNISCDRLLGSNVQLVDPPFNWRQLWEILKPQCHYFIAAILSALVVALANIQIPLLLGEVVNVLSRFTDGDSNERVQFMEEILKPSYQIMKVYVTQASFTFLYITFLTRMGERMASDLRKKLFNALLEQDIEFYDQHKTGELVNRLTADVQDFKSSFKMVVSQGMRSVTQIVGCGASLYSISPQMAGLTAFVVPVIIAVGTTLGTLLRGLSKAAQQQVGLSTAVANECLGNMRTVRAFAMEDEEAKLFAREVNKSCDLNENLGMGIGIFQAGANLFLNGVVLGTLYAGGAMLSSRQLLPGDLMSFLVSAQTIQRSLGQLSILFGTYVRGISAGARVFEYINVKPKIWLKGGYIIPFHSLLGSVEFKNVCFSYPTRPHQEVLTDFSLKVPAGKVVAIVGASGGGKSTIAQLLERFYDVKLGSVCIDDEDIRDLDPSWLRGRVLGFINQEPVLFATSVMENIRYGRPGATDQEVLQAAKTANADDFIQGFPNGYETVVGERGVTVSGGQKQRIAIARALLKDPNILILDEATSALDAESESIVQKALETCAKGRTVIIIAHRLSTIQNADIIAVMSKGKLAEIGTHESLKRLGGIYADLIKQQQREDGKDMKKSFWS